MTNNAQTSTAGAVASGQQHAGLIGSLFPIVLMVLVFYFLIIRPQQKREAKRRELINSAKRGDKVLTASGIIGIIHKVVSEKEIALEISSGVCVRMLKDSVSDILEKNSELGKEEIAESAAGKQIPKKQAQNKK